MREVYACEAAEERSGDEEFPGVRGALRGEALDFVVEFGFMSSLTRVVVVKARAVVEKRGGFLRGGMVVVGVGVGVGRVWEVLRG